MTGWACYGKEQYTTWAAAKAKAKLLRRSKSAVASPYSCRECGRYHVGNAVGGSDLSGRLKRARLNKIQEREAWL